MANRRKKYPPEDPMSIDPLEPIVPFKPRVVPEHSLIYTRDGRTFAGKEVAEELIRRWLTAIQSDERFIKIEIYNEDPANDNAQTDLTTFAVNFIGMIGSGGGS